jgi:hypothetical protein
MTLNKEMMMFPCTSPRPEFPGYCLAEGCRGDDLIEAEEWCYLVLIYLDDHEERRILVTPTRRRAPLPNAKRPSVTIRWLIACPERGLTWREGGVEMANGWPGHQPHRIEVDGNMGYELTVPRHPHNQAHVPQNKVSYPYTLHLMLEGRQIIIDPEIEYDDDY